MISQPRAVKVLFFDTTSEESLVAEIDIDLNLQQGLLQQQ
jgi:hypothetical protein